MKLILAISCIWLCFSALLQAQTHPDHIKQINPIEEVQSWRIFKNTDGLISGEIRAICQAQDESIWFAGQQGLCRYDGMNWEIFTPKNSQAPSATNTILTDRQGHLWVGSETGVTKFDGHNWITYTPQNGLPGPIVTALIETQEGDLWAGCGTREWLTVIPQGGLAKWDGQKWHNIEINIAPFHVNRLFQAKDGALWIATQTGIFKYENGLLSNYTTGLTTSNVLSVSQATDGTIWIGTQKGLFYLHKDQWQKLELEGQQLAIKSIQKTSDGKLWAFAGSQLFQFSKNMWKKVSMPVAGPGDILHGGLYKTNGDVLWLTGLQVVKFNYGNPKWLSFRNIEGPPTQSPDGRLWFKQKEGGVISIQDKATIHYPDIAWPLFFDQKGKGWSIRNGTLSDWQNGIWTSHPQTLDHLNTFYQTQSGTLWFAGKYQGQATIVCFNGATWKSYDQTHWGLPLPNGFLKIVASPQEDLWFIPEPGSKLVGYGAIQFNGQHMQHRNSRDAYSSSEIDAMDTWHYEMAGRVYDIAIDTTGTVWVATGLGLKFFDGTQWSIVEEGGPKNKKATRLCIDQNGYLWCSCADTKKGPGGIFVKKNDQWLSYTMSVGLTSHNIWAITETADGAMWFGTTSGANRFDGKSWTTYNTKGQLLEDDVRYIFQDSTQTIWFGTGHHEGKWWATRYHPDHHHPNTQWSFLPSNELSSNNILLSWTGSDRWKDTQTNKLVYSWQTDHSDWSVFSNDVKLALFDLKSGEHTIQVRARDIDGNIDPTPAKFEFHILPPTWQQPWFLVLIATLLSAIGYLSIRVIKRDRDLSISNKALFEANEQLFTTNRSLENEMLERERLDSQIRNLHFLYTLRAALSEKHTHQEIIQTIGTAIIDILQSEANLVITLDDQSYAFGHPSQGAKYTRDLVWGERLRGTFTLHSSFTLSESQERTLLDETAGQLTRILESRELQMQLLQSARLVSLGQMAAGVAHELNQPLGGISATAEDYYLRLQDNMSVSNEQLTETFKRILGMVDRMSNTVEHLRIFSRDTSQEPGRPLNVNDVLQSSLDIIGTQLKNHGINVKLDLTEGLSPIIGHPYQVEQIFLNLLGNARDALDAPSATHVKTITITTHQQSDTIIAKVQDNGTGIDQEHLSRIFEPFYTTKPADKGTGLGLSITYAIVKNHGGNISCTSTKNRGTIFEVTFPISQPTT